MITVAKIERSKNKDQKVVGNRKHLLLLLLVFFCTFLTTSCSCLLFFAILTLLYKYPKKTFKIISIQKEKIGFLLVTFKKKSVKNNHKKRSFFLVFDEAIIYICCLKIFFWLKHFFQWLLFWTYIGKTDRFGCIYTSAEQRT